MKTKENSQNTTEAIKFTAIVEGIRRIGEVTHADRRPMFRDDYFSLKQEVLLEILNHLPSNIVKLDLSRMSLDPNESLVIDRSYDYNGVDGVEWSTAEFLEYLGDLGRSFE